MKDFSLFSNFLLFLRLEEACLSSSASLCAAGGVGGGNPEQRLQVEIQNDEDNLAEMEKEVLEDSPAPQRRYSLSQAVTEERREMRFNR